MSFLDCGGGTVWFQVEDKHDFSVNEDGGVYALHHLNLRGKEKAVLVYAHDLHTKQVWKARIHLRVHPSNSTQTEVKLCLYSSHVFDILMFVLYFDKRAPPTHLTVQTNEERC